MLDIRTPSVIPPPPLWQPPGLWTPEKARRRPRSFPFTRLPLWAAIAFDAATNGGSHAQPSLTFGPTLTGANRIIMIGGWSDTGLDDLGVCTVDGVTAGFIGKEHNSVDGAFYWGRLWAGMAPASGTVTVVINGTAGTIYGGSVSYTGAKQTGQPDASATGEATGSPFSVPLTTIANNCWAVQLTAADNGATGAGSGTTLRLQVLANYFEMWDSNGPITPAGLTSLPITYTNHAPGAVIASIAPAVASSDTQEWRGCYPPERNNRQINVCY